MSGAEREAAFAAREILAGGNDCLRLLDGLGVCDLDGGRARVEDTGEKARFIGRIPQPAMQGRLRDLTYAMVRDSPVPVISV